jgi:hypothetical protein
MSLKEEGVKTAAIGDLQNCIVHGVGLTEVIS